MKEPLILLYDPNKISRYKIQSLYSEQNESFREHFEGTPIIPCKLSEPIRLIGVNKVNKPELMKLLKDALGEFETISSEKHG